MNTRLIFIILLCGIGSYSNAQQLELQQVTYQTYDFSNATTSTHPFKKYSFRKKGTSSFEKVGAFGNNIKPYFDGNEDALAELKKYKTKRAIATYSGLAAIGTFITFAAINLSDTEVDSPESSGPKSTGLLGVTAGLAILDFILAASSNKHMVNAVNIHNSSQKNRFGLNFRLMEIDRERTKRYSLGSTVTFRF